MRVRYEKRKKQIRQAFALLLAVCILAAAAEPVRVKADVFDDAHAYYSAYADRVKFWSVGPSEGFICYATRANRSTASIRFRTLGWKATVRGADGSALQSIYFQLGGAYLKRVDMRVVDGYEYNLYRMSLSALKSRMSGKANAALEAGNCTIVLDACMTTVKNDTVQGSMTDAGSFSGKVYTTYDGIAGAAGWSASGKASLHSYYDKEVENLFHNIQVGKAEGIKSVSGGGRYLYGTKIRVSAVLKQGYGFDGWKGMKSGDTLDLSFYVNGSGTLTAYAKPVELNIVYHRNFSSKDKTTEEQTMVYGQENPNLKGAVWKKNKKPPLGWALSQGAAEPKFDLKAGMTNAWIAKRAPQVHLYAVWEKEPELPDPEPEKPELPEPTPEPEKPELPDPEPEKPELPDPEPELPDPEPEPENPEPTPELPDPTPGLVPPSDGDLPQAKPVRMRFISQRYFEDESGSLVPRTDGGLNEGSRWAANPACRELLRQVLKMTAEL